MTDSDARGLRSAPPPAPDGEGLSVSREPQTRVSFGSSSVKDSNAEEERAFSPRRTSHRRLRRRCRYRRRPPKRKNSVLADTVREASSGRRVAARDSRAGEEDWTKRKKQNKTSKAEAEEQKKSIRRPRAERVEAGLQRRK
ncbi:hypothetical protein P5V15_007210 [Pogonomyrmex californicus]